MDAKRAYNLFVDDLVWKVDSTRYECGLVMEHVNYNSDDDEYGSEIVRDGTVHVVWYPAGDEETVKVDKVRNCDLVTVSVLQLRTSFLSSGD
jgi:hypothetical protein